MPTKVWDFLINTSQDSFVFECQIRTDAAFMQSDMIEVEDVWVSVWFGRVC